MNEREDVIGRLDQLMSIQNELESILQTLVLNDSTIIDAMAQMFGLNQKINARIEQGNTHTSRLTSQIESLIAGVAELAPATPGEPIVVLTDAFSERNPEIALLQYLGAFLNDLTALDVGAHVGEFAERLLASGYRVHAFEPFPPSFNQLEARLGRRREFTAAPIAVGSADGDGILHVAHDVAAPGDFETTQFNSLVPHPLGTSFQFDEALPVKVRSLASLRASGEIPRDIGLLKIDSEGNDLAVILGMGLPDYDIVMAEYWDAEHAFGRAGHGHLAPIVDAMRERGFGRHIIIYHIDEDDVISFYFNTPYTVPKSWGNAIFFRDRALFAKAARWCESALRPTFAR